MDYLSAYGQYLVMRISHILVKQAYEADDVLRLLKQELSKSKDPSKDLPTHFARLATKHSTCSSAKQGGNLGVVHVRSLDEDFAEAIKSLKVGELSPVVRTRFGYHLILRLEENS